MLAAASIGPTSRGLASDKPDTGFVVAAYWSGRDTDVNRFPIGELTHINFSFVRLHDGRVGLRGSRDSSALARLVSLKQKYPGLKVSVSLGGWGGCETCSDVFASDAGRDAFALSVKALLDRFGLDGIDLDWEYPAIEGYPGHRYAPEDRHNFTLLVQNLRRVLGDSAEITFAAGAFPEYLAQAVEWSEVMPVVDRVYLMTYDLVNGYSTVTGNHTPLFSTSSQIASADNAVRYLDSLGVPRQKIVLGAAFYARIWGDVADTNNGLYQNGRFTNFVSFKELESYWKRHPGFEAFWDSTASAPYRYNPREKLFATFDDQRSVSLKTRYALAHGLGGIMFWELNGDAPRDGLLDAIDSTRRSASTVPPKSTK